MSNQPTLPGICLDGVYSKALLTTALQSGHAVLHEEAKNLSKIRPDLLPHLLDQTLTRRFRQPALEMAVLFDRVHMFGLPGGFDLRATCARLEGLLGLAFITGQQLGEESPLAPHLLERMKPQMIRPIIRRVNANMRAIHRPQFPFRTVSAAYDAVHRALQYNVNVLKLRHTLEKLTGNPALLTDSELPYRDAVVEMLKSAMAADKPQDRPFVLHFIAFIDILGACQDALEPLVISMGFNSPLLTAQPDIWTPNKQVFDDRSETFRLCRFAMEEVVGYAPAVESMNDVLRLRAHPAIHRFRQCLKEWELALHDPRENTLQRIKQDIIKANQELRTLEKCRKVERWIFWSHLPLSLVPILSHIVVYLDMGLRLWTEKKQENSSWVLLGR